MPSKIQLDENLWFLFICLQKSDYKTIDFNSVGQATNLKPPAARMRYTRLRRQIEGGTLIGTHGTPFSGMTEKGSLRVGKCTNNPQRVISKDEPQAMFENPIPPDRRMKSEPKEFSDLHQTDTSEVDHSEDEMPLAKRRNKQSKTGGSSYETSVVTFAEAGFVFGFHDGQGNDTLVPATRPNISQSRHETHKNDLKLLRKGHPNKNSCKAANHRLDVSGKPLEELSPHLSGDDNSNLWQNLPEF